MNEYSKKKLKNVFDIDAYCAFVMEKAIERKNLLREEAFNIHGEVNFFMGAMTVLAWIDEGGMVPSQWLIGPMTGYSIIELELKYRKEKQEEEG